MLGNHLFPLLYWIVSIQYFFFFFFRFFFIQISSALSPKIKNVFFCNLYSSSSNNLFYTSGCADGVTCNDTSDFNNSIIIAQKSDIVVLAFGIDTSLETNGMDRIDLNLPGYQNQLISEILNSLNSDTTVILVIMNGGCVDISKWQDNTV